MAANTVYWYFGDKDDVLVVSLVGSAGRRPTPVRRHPGRAAARVLWVGDGHCGVHHRRSADAFRIQEWSAEAGAW
ncbi:hypothetical protein [Rhodococcoides corynebacterioides]|uniref:hypothetical protein n=1 Tax=Rhodococcoides corynebacterioides TaxID=53972 RepID=UPI0027E1CF95|nr:hypothetical protein [Rhodococcus corynebacterioides]